MNKKEKAEIASEIGNMINMLMLPIKSLSIPSSYRDGFIEACNSIKNMIEARYIKEG
jgi:hypothetical protein